MTHPTPGSALPPDGGATMCQHPMRIHNYTTPSGWETGICGNALPCSIHPPVDGERSGAGEGGAQELTPTHAPGCMKWLAWDEPDSCTCGGVEPAGNDVRGILAGYELAGNSLVEDELRARVAQLEATLSGQSKLAAFGAWALTELRDDELGDLDGGAAQDAALRLGVLESVSVAEPCGDACHCAEYGDFPLECYRYPADIAAALRASERPEADAADPSRSTPNASAVSTYAAEVAARLSAEGERDRLRTALVEATEAGEHAVATLRTVAGERDALRADRDRLDAISVPGAMTRVSMRALENRADPPLRRFALASIPNGPNSSVSSDRPTLREAIDAARRAPTPESSP